MFCSTGPAQHAPLMHCAETSSGMRTKHNVDDKETPIVRSVLGACTCQRLVGGLMVAALLGRWHVSSACLSCPYSCKPDAPLLKLLTFNVASEVCK